MPAFALGPGSLPVRHSCGSRNPYSPACHACVCPGAGIPTRPSFLRKQESIFPGLSCLCNDLPLALPSGSTPDMPYLMRSADNIPCKFSQRVGLPVEAGESCPGAVGAFPCQLSGAFQTIN